MSRTKYTKQGLLHALDNLREWVENNKNKQQVKAVFEELEVALEHVEPDFGDCFGTEGFKRTIFGWND